jgi:hypothetical protein
MPYVTGTAYPCLKAHPTAKELGEIYTPNLFEVALAEEHTRQPAPRVGLVLLLKTFQRLGYFVPYAEIPSFIVSHIARCAGYSGVPEGMVASDASTARDRHMAQGRAFIGVTAYGHAARQIMVEARLEAARTRDDLADIIYYRKVVSDGFCANVAYTLVWGLGTPPTGSIVADCLVGTYSAPFSGVLAPRRGMTRILSP